MRTPSPAPGAFGRISRTLVGSRLIAGATLALVGCPLIAGAFLQHEDDVTAEVILERHAEATGGRAAWEKLTTRTSRGTVLHTSSKARALLTVHETRSTDRSWRERSEQLGEQLEGSSGDVAWTWSLMSGPRLMTGAARARALREAPLDAITRWREHFTTVEHLGVEDIQDVPCQVVRLTPSEGSAETRYYEAESGLLVRTEAVLAMEGSRVPAVITYADHRWVDGILLPHTIRKALGDIEELVITLEEVEHGVDVPSSFFEAPAEISALVESR